MQPAPLIAASGLVLGLAACHPLPQRAVTRLDCPTSAGELTRVNAAADGRACLYRSAAGADVSLRLLPVNGDPRAALAGVEQEVRALVAAAPATEASARDARAKAAERLGVPAPSVADPAARRAMAEAAADAAEPVSDAGDADDWDGDHAEVDLPGIHVRAHGDDADVQLGPMRIVATDGDAVIRTSRDVRLRGESLSREKRGLRASFLMVQDGRAIGYEAAGPRAGPLTVAVLQLRGDDDNMIDHRLRRDVRRLVRRNGGA